MITTPDHLADDFLELLSANRRQSPKAVRDSLREIAACNINAALATAFQLGLRAQGTDYAAPLVHALSDDVEPFLS